MKVIVQFSGGKDSMASLIFVLENITKNPMIIFCDTGFEAKETYDYIDYVEAKIKLPITRIKSKKYESMWDLAEKKKRFPSTRARFCTEELKVKPMIDFILDEIKEDFIAIQGIRKDESEARSKMEAQCTYFKFYFEPYSSNSIKIKALEKKEKLNKKDANKLLFLKSRLEKGKEDYKYHTYRKKEIKLFVSEYANDILRPVFDWTANHVIEHIKSKGFEVNPLYKKGFKRVGCFPCVMSNQTDIKSLNLFYPERIKEISDFEIKTGSSLFPPDKIPKRFCKNKNYPTINEIVEYLREDTLSMFEENTSCLSFYNVCE